MTLSWLHKLFHSSKCLLDTGYVFDDLLRLTRTTYMPRLKRVQCYAFCLMRNTVGLSGLDTFLPIHIPQVDAGRGKER
ncbi:hypothetical protein VULLAG_LOCUS634 [Vulpes lagopus]